MGKSSTSLIIATANCMCVYPADLYHSSTKWGVIARCIRDFRLQMWEFLQKRSRSFGNVAYRLVVFESTCRLPPLCTVFEHKYGPTWLDTDVVSSVRFQFLFVIFQTQVPNLQTSKNATSNTLCLEYFCIDRKFCTQTCFVPSLVGFWNSSLHGVALGSPFGKHPVQRWLYCSYHFELPFRRFESYADHTKRFKALKDLESTESHTPTS